MAKLDLLILGAGAAGLNASRLARQAGKRAVTLEGRGRLGGRMWTIAGGSESFAIELGAEYVHGPAPATEELAREFGLSFVQVADRHFRHEKGRWRPAGDYWERLGRVFARIPARGDRSFADFARESLRERAGLEAVSFVESFHGAPAEDISALSLRQSRADFEEAGQVRRILGGYGRLVEKLAAECGRIQLNSIVERIDWRRSEVEVSARTLSGTRRFRARRLLVTLPAGVLRERGVIFSPEPRAVMEALDGVGMGDALRMTARLNAPLRAVPGAAFWHLEKEELPVWWTPGPEGRPIVTAWCGGPRARALLEQGIQRARKIATKNLRRIAHVRGARFHAHDWRHDQFSRGAYSYARVNKKNAGETFFRAIDRTIFFAGEAYFSDGERATVEGALASARRAIEKIFI